MRRQPTVTVLIFLFSVCSALAQSRTTRAAAWRQDLNYLATNLPALHVNAFFQTTRDEFNTAVQRLNDRIPELSDAEITVELARIVASISDAHTYIPLNQFAAGFHFYPIRLEWLSDGLFVTHATGDYEYLLTIPGEVAIPELNLCLKAIITEATDVPGRPCLLDPDQLPPVLTVRNWRAGDRFWPAHTKEPQKVKELLNDHHVTGPEKKLWPVLVAGNDLVWLRGFPAPEQLRPRSRRALRLEETCGLGAKS